MNSRVLIGFADALAGIESAWCLADHGFEVHAFTRRGSRPAMARSRKVRVIEVTAPEDDALACAAEIAAAAARLAPAAVLPLDDHAVWLCDRAFGESQPAIVAGPTGRLATLALDKREQLLAAEAAGFAVPPYTLTPTDWPTLPLTPTTDRSSLTTTHATTDHSGSRGEQSELRGRPAAGVRRASRPGEASGEQPQDGGGVWGVRSSPPREHGELRGHPAAGVRRASRPGEADGGQPQDGGGVWGVWSSPPGKHGELRGRPAAEVRRASRPGEAVTASNPRTEGGSGGCGFHPPGNTENTECIVKPALAVELHAGVLRRGSGRVVATAEQMRSAAAAIDGPVIVQPRITGVGEGVFGLAVHGRPAVLTAHRRIRMMNPRGSGSSACRSTPVPDDVAGPVRRMIAAVGWHGLFMIELLRDTEGRPWFMELNGRTWGSMALATKRGYPYPSWAVRAAIEPGFEPAEPEQTPHITARHLGREMVHLGFVLAGGGAPRLATARDVLTWRRDDRWYNYRRGEAGVFVADTLATLRAQIAPRLTRRSR